MTEQAYEPLIFKHMREEVPNPKQQLFFKAKAKHIGYGGARGGGKSWAGRRKAVLLCMHYDDLRVLLLHAGEQRSQFIISIVFEGLIQIQVVNGSNDALRSSLGSQQCQQYQAQQHADDHRKHIHKCAQHGTAGVCDAQHGAIIGQAGMVDGGF